MVGDSSNSQDAGCFQQCSLRLAITNLPIHDLLDQCFQRYLLYIQEFILIQFLVTEMEPPGDVQSNPLIGVCAGRQVISQLPPFISGDTGFFFQLSFCSVEPIFLFTVQLSRRDFRNDFIDGVTVTTGVGSAGGRSMVSVR